MYFEGVYPTNSVQLLNHACRPVSYEGASSSTAFPCSWKIAVGEDFRALCLRLDRIKGGFHLLALDDPCVPLMWHRPRFHSRLSPLVLRWVSTVLFREGVSDPVVVSQTEMFDNVCRAETEMGVSVTSTFVVGVRSRAPAQSSTAASPSSVPNPRCNIPS